MIPANLSIFREDYAPRSTRVVPTADGSASVYSALAVGRIVGQGRTIPALVCEEIGTEDKWHVINMYVAGGYMGTVAVLGATSGEQAGEWVGRQILPYLSGGQSSYCACDGVASAEALQAVLDSAATSVIRLPIRQKDIDTFEGRITDNPVVWDNDALQSHTAAELIHELAKHDREGQMMDAMCKDDLPKVVSQYDGIFALFDALIVDYNRLGLMQDRLFAAMHKANVGSVKPLTVTPTKPFKRNGVTNVAVLFEMDDGQTVTIIFHSPDATPAKLGPKDTLTSWKWLLNKRDVTVAVAPDNGENVQLPALARRILLLVEKNSARFKRTNVKKAEQMQDLADTTSRVEQKTAALDGLNAEIEGLQKQIDAGVAAPAAAVPAPDNWIGADRVFVYQAPNEYGPAHNAEASLYARAADPGSTTLETIIRPSGARFNMLYLTLENGEIESDSVKPGDNLADVTSRLQQSGEKSAKLFAEMKAKVDAENSENIRIAKENNLVVGKLLGSIIPNTGKLLRAAKITVDHGDGSFDVLGVAGNKDSVIKDMSASRIVRAMNRANENKPAATASTGPDVKDDTQGEQAPEDGRLTPETAGNMKDGDIVKTADGTEYMAMGARHDWLEVAPMVNGKPVVNNQDTFKFLLTPEKASAYPERRTDPVYPTGRNYYADKESAKANMTDLEQKRSDVIDGLSDNNLEKMARAAGILKTGQSVDYEELQSQLDMIKAEDFFKLIKKLGINAAAPADSPAADNGFKEAVDKAVTNLLKDMSKDGEIKDRLGKASARMDIADIGARIAEEWYNYSSVKALRGKPMPVILAVRKEFEARAMDTIMEMAESIGAINADTLAGYKSAMAKVNAMTDAQLKQLSASGVFAASTRQNMLIELSKMRPQDIERIIKDYGDKPNMTTEDATTLIGDVLADITLPDDYGTDFDQPRQEARFEKDGVISGFVIMQDTTDATDTTLTEIEVQVNAKVNNSGQLRAFVIPFFGRTRTGDTGSAVTGGDIENLKSAITAKIDKMIKDSAAQAVKAAPTYAPEPDATALTPKQYHEAKLAKIASDSGASMSEVRENYDNEAERKANESKWVEAVRQAAKEGKTISRATLDKMDEIRPGAVGSLMHDYPDADIPNGYQLPGARKSEAASKPNKKFDGYIMTAADSLDKLRLSDIDRVLDQATTKDEMLQLATYMVSRRPGIRDHVLQSFKDVLIENGWNKAFREVPNAPKEIPTNSTDAVKHLKRLFNVLEKAGVKVGLRPDDRKTLRFSVVTAGRDTVSGQMSMGYVLSGDPSWSVDRIRLSPITNQAEKTVLKIMQDAALWLNGEKIDFKSDAFSEDKTWAANSPLGAKWQADIVDAARSTSEASQEPAAAPAAPAQSSAPASDPDADLLNAIISGTTSAADVDMDALIAIAEKYDGKPEMEGLVNKALEVVTQYELDAAKAIG